MSLSDGGDAVASSSTTHHSAQVDPRRVSRSPSNSLHSDVDLDVKPDGSENSNSPPPVQRSAPGDVRGEDGSEGSVNENGLDLDDESVPDRPNKFHGPASTWRSWTEQERMLAASLDQIRAADLSIHLYNAHAMKRKLRTREQQDRVSAWARKERWIRTKDSSEESGEGEDEGSTFVPPKVWTAWPMPPDEVPREGEKKLGQWEDDDEVWTLRRQMTGVASEELQDVLVAEVLKAAKEKFDERGSEDSKEEVGDADSTTGVSTRKSSKDSKLEPKEQEDVAGSENHQYLRPVIMADDEQALDILKPTVRHILTKLDDLLMGLHRARQAYLPTGDDSASETQTDIDESSPAPRKDTKKPRRRSLRSSTTRTQADVSIHPDPDSDSGSNFSVPLMKSPTLPQSRTRKRRRTRLSPTSAAISQRKRQQRLGLRDWSDVLGVGSMVGWDSPVIERAAKRCAELFDERISLRMLEEGKQEYTELEFGCGEATAIEKTGIHHNRRSHKFTGVVEPANDGLYYCPFQDCKRIQKGFSRTWNLKKHVRELHEDRAPPISNVEVEAELVGGVHVDGFMKPIPSRRGWSDGSGRRKYTGR